VSTQLSKQRTGWSRGAGYAPFTHSSTTAITYPISRIVLYHIDLAYYHLALSTVAPSAPQAQEPEQRQTAPVLMRHLCSGCCFTAVVRAKRRSLEPTGPHTSHKTVRSSGRLRVPRPRTARTGVSATEQTVAVAISRVLRLSRATGERDGRVRGYFNQQIKRRATRLANAEETREYDGNVLAISVRHLHIAAPLRELFLLPMPSRLHSQLLCTAPGAGLGLLEASLTAFSSTCATVT
jgi:hypothetical protein